MTPARAGALAGAMAVLLACGNSAGEPKKGTSAMTGYFTEPTLSSAALAGAYVLRCSATGTVDKPFGNVPKGGFPSLYERELELAACTVIHGSATAPAKATLTG